MNTESIKALLTIDLLIKEAELFCTYVTSSPHPQVVGVTDGKAINLNRLARSSRRDKKFLV